MNTSTERGVRRPMAPSAIEFSSDAETGSFSENSTGDLSGNSSGNSPRNRVDFHWVDDIVELDSMDEIEGFESTPTEARAEAWAEASDSRESSLNFHMAGEPGVEPEPAVEEPPEIQIPEKDPDTYESPAGDPPSRTPPVEAPSDPDHDRPPYET